MTLEEAKETLKKKGYCLKKVTDYHPTQAGLFDGVSKCAVATVNANGYIAYYNDTRKDYEKVNQIVDELIEEEGESFKGGHLNPALKDSAKEFNDSLLDEQAKKIKDLEKKNAILNEKVVTISNELSAERFTNKVISKKNKKIASLKKSIKEKDDVIDTISEELRLSKVREEELIETVKDYLALVGDKDEEIKKLKKQLAKYKRGRFVKQKFMPYGAQYRDNHNFVVTEKPKPDIVIVKAPF